MAERIELLQMRYTLPGLGYFLLLYIFLIIFKPVEIDLSADNTWIELGAIAVVGSVPIGYLIHQGYLLWNFICGRTEHFPHIKELGEFIKTTKLEKILLKIDGENCEVNIEELRKKLIQLGQVYIKETFVKFNKDTINKYGYLTPLHDLIFMGTKIHDAYYLGAWTYARITRAFLGSMILALIVWIYPFYDRFFLCNFENSQIRLLNPQLLLSPAYLIALEFIVLAFISYFVSKWSRKECDINERFLTWLYINKKECKTQSNEIKEN